MSDTQIKRGQRIPFKLMGFSVMLLSIAVGCATTSSIEKELAKKYSREGESIRVPYSSETVSNAIVLWSQALTNGYVLYGNADTRGEHMSLRDEPATLFLLRNGTNGIGVWGKSACLPPEKPYYSADIIIRLLPVSEGSRLAVAIHGEHIVRGLVFNIHTYEFEHEKIAELPSCPQDELEVLKEMELTLQKSAKP